MNTVMYGSSTIHYRLRRRPRSTMEIAVEPSGEVSVVAPEKATIEAVEQCIRRRGRWILQQQQFFAEFTPRTPARRYVPGETHLYLGRQYRLRLEEGTRRTARLVRGFILVSGVEAGDHAAVERLVTDWYRKRAEVQLRRRVEINRARFANPELFRPAALQIRRMAARWGSMSASRRLRLHPDLIKAPVDGIDYVITHELCHLAIPNHSPAFFDLQGQVMPDWLHRKSRLEKALA